MHESQPTNNSCHRILVIDDNTRIHQDFRKVLCPPALEPDLEQSVTALFGPDVSSDNAACFEVECASQGEVGLALLKQALAQQRPFSVAFVDVRMPNGWDGVETVRQLWACCPELQVVLCTAYSDHSWRSIAEALGRSDNLLILKKPFDSIEVLQLAHALARKWVLTRQAALRMEELETMARRQAEELVEAEKRLLRSQRLESIGTLASGIAHDLNNVLAPIVMLTHVLELSQPREEDREVIESIQDCAQRGADIVKQVLTFARGVPGQRMLLQSRHLIKEMAKLAEQTFPKNIKVCSLAPNDLWTAWGDATQLQQVLMNLCLNARDAMPEGGSLLLSAENVHVQEATPSLFGDAKPGPHVLLRVGDTGEGIPPENLESIFEPFFTTKEAGKGTGLGLSTVLGVVRSHGGFVNVKSQPGRGSTFEVYLPAAPDLPAASPEPGLNSPPDGHRQRILVVDDEAPIRNAMCKALACHGYEIVVAADGKEALDLVSRQALAFDAVLTDLMMPGLGGVALIQVLRQSHPQLPVLVYTGWKEPSVAERIKELGVLDILEKPCPVERLLAVLHQRLRAPAPE